MNYLEKVEMCKDCGECDDVCPILEVRDKEIYAPSKKIKLLPKLKEGKKLSSEEIDSIYLSTMCGACEEACPEDIPITDILKREREILTKNNQEPKKTAHISSNILEKKNPGGQDNQKRRNWVTDDLEFSEDSDVAYMAGCWISFKYPEIAQNTVKILNEGGIKPKLLDKERCCGLFLTDNGHMEEAEEYIKEYVNYIEKLGINKLLVSCPACYGQIKEEYPKLYREPEFEVASTLEIFQKLIEQEKIDLKDNDNLAVSIRDGCPLSDNYDLPRKILKEIDYDIKEIFNKETFCCGAPAGVKPNYPEIADEIGLISIKKGQDTDALISYCPFCLYHLEDIKDRKNKKIKLKDISGIIKEKLN